MEGFVVAVQMLCLLGWIGSCSYGIYSSEGNFMWLGFFLFFVIWALSQSKISKD